MAKINKTKYAILGVLSQMSGSGYDIKKCCDTSIAYFWNENYGHIYPVLKKMEEEEKNDSGDDPPRRNVVNQRFVSTTDPEASVVRKGQGKAKLHYQTHRGIDGAYGVITATIVGPGDENEAHRLADLIEAHQEHTGHNVEVAVADSKYGTTANFLTVMTVGLSLTCRC